MCIIIKLMIILTNIIIVNVFIWFDKVLKKHGLTEYMDETFIRNTSRELITALQVSPDELNAAADALLKQEIQSSSTAAPKFPAGPRQSTPSQAAAPLPRAAPRQKKPQPANLMMPGRQGYTDR